MERNSGVVFEEMQTIFNEMVADNTAWVEKGNKAAAARVRKATLAIAKLGKEYRELTVAEAKK